MFDGLLASLAAARSRSAHAGRTPGCGFPPGLAALMARTGMTLETVLAAVGRVSMVLACDWCRAPTPGSRPPSRPASSRGDRRARRRQLAARRGACFGDLGGGAGLRAEGPYMNNLVDQGVVGRSLRAQTVQPSAVRTDGWSAQ